METPRVLVVDDEPTTRKLIAEALSSEPYEVDVAADAEAALQKVQTGSFSLLLLDLRMPGMGGMELLRRLSETRPEIRVIIVSGRGTLHDAVETIKLGAVDFIEKPFNPRELRSVVAHVFARENLPDSAAETYEGRLSLAKRCAANHDIDAAREHVRRAIGLDSSRPEAFNLLGLLLESTGDKLQALKNYRAALDLDPTYQPANENLKRAAGGR